MATVTFGHMIVVVMNWTVSALANTVLGLEHINVPTGRLLYHAELDYCRLM